jgi:hypothetical protein
VKRSLVTLALAACALAGCEQQPEGEPIARAEIGGNALGRPRQQTASPEDAQPTIASQVESACRSVIFEDSSLTHCLAVPSRHRISTALAEGDGENYRSLSALAGARDPETVSPSR